MLTVSIRLLAPLKLTKVPIGASGKAMPWFARTRFPWTSGSCASLARCSGSAGADYPGDEVRTRTTSIAQCVHAYNPFQSTPPYIRQRLLCMGLFFIFFVNALLQENEQIRVATGAWDGAGSAHQTAEVQG